MKKYRQLTTELTFRCNAKCPACHRVKPLRINLNDKKYKSQTFVVHCAGRTRSIIAYQTLTDFNFSNKKYVLNGNDRAKDLKTVAYINPVDKTSMIDVVSLPKLPENQYYQLRAELEDKMVSLGYLEDYQRTLKPIPYMEDALALSIVIQNKNGESTSEENNEVAEISLKK